MVNFTYSHGKEHRGILWILTFTRAGITAMRGVPVDIQKNRSRLARRKVRTRALEELRERPRGAQSLALFLRTDRELDRSYRLELRIEQPRPDGSTEIRRESHLPGDWVYPTTLWRPGEVVQDVFLYRIRQRAPGTVAISVALHDGDNALVPESSSVSLVDGAYVPLNTSRFSPRARPAMRYLLEMLPPALDFVLEAPCATWRETMSLRRKMRVPILLDELVETDSDIVQSGGSRCRTW